MYLFEENQSDILIWGQIKEIHRALRCNQSAWLKQYIDFATNKRTSAKNSFVKDLYKIIDNSVFGKNCKEYSQMGKR